KDKGAQGDRTLTQLANMPNDDAHRVGWMHPVWDNKDNKLDVQVSKDGGTEGHWGVGVTIVMVVYVWPFPQPVPIQATSNAYVVDAAGVSTAAANSSTGTKKPPPAFRPTYYVRLAYHS